MDQHDDVSRSREDRLAAVLAFADAGSWEYDLIAERSLGRENVDVLFGIDPDPSELTLDLLLERIHPEDHAGFLVAIDEARRLQRDGRTGRVEFDDFRVRLPDGAVRWLAARASVTDRGTLEGLIRNITQRRLAQEQASEHAQRFDALVRASADAILTVDRDGRLVFASDATEELVGRPPTELVGRGVDELIGEFVPLDATEAHGIATGLLSGTRSEGYVELWMRRPDGELFLSEHHVKAIEDASGRPDGFVSVVRDITHHLRTQEELIAARDAAEAGLRERSTFLARTSHELRTPMNAVLGFAQLLDMEEELGPDARSSVEHILRAGRHLLVLLDDVLDLARFDAGALRITSEPVEVRAVVTESADLVRSRAAERGIDLRVDTRTPPVVVRADQQRLRQVLINLLTNAVTYNRDDGTVDVAWTAVGDAVRIDVRDTGPGIVDDDLARLFMPFERLDAEQRGIPGTGLGLSLSRSFVEVMGGRLDVATCRGKGSTFSVTLPLEASPETAAPDAAASAAARAPVRGRVVYIEDNAANLVLMRRGLARLPGVELLTATDATSGLDLVRREKPDLVLLDRQLPDGRAEDVLAELRRTPIVSTIPVVVVGSDSSSAAEGELRQAGIIEFLLKPLDLPKLLTLIDRILPGGQASPPLTSAAPSAYLESPRAGPPSSREAPTG